MSFLMLSRARLGASTRLFSTSSRAQDFARATLVGTLVRAPELKTTKADKEYVSYTVVTNAPPKEPGERGVPTFHKVLAFPNHKEFLTRLPQGALVFVEAVLDVREPDPEAPPDSFSAQRQVVLKHENLRVLRFPRRPEES